MTNPNNIAIKIKETAKQRNIQMGDLFENTGLSKGTLYSMTNGGSFPKSDNLIKIADYLDCSIDYLLDRSDIIDCKKEISKQPSDQEILQKFKSLSERDRKVILDLMDCLTCK